MPPRPVMYDPLAGPLMTTFRFHGTVVPKVIRHPGFWIFSIINLIIFFLYHFEIISELDCWKMNSDGLKAVAGITTFFEVFYTNACYDRFKRFWGLNKTMCQKIYDFVMVMQLLARPTGKPYARLAARWLAVLQIVATSRGHRKEAAWQKLVKLDYVTEEEAKLLSGLKDSQRVLLVCHAVGDLARVAVEDAKAPLNILSVPLKHLMHYTDLAEEVEDLMMLPIPYEYFHLLNFMITFYLSMSAYSLGLSHSYWAPVFFLIQCMIYMGMLELASQLADPFGDDHADFPLHYWTKEFLDNLSVLVSEEMIGSKARFKDELEREGKKQTRFTLSLVEVENILFGTTTTDNVGNSPTSTPGCEFLTCYTSGGGKGPDGRRNSDADPKMTSYAPLRSEDTPGNP